MSFFDNMIKFLFLFPFSNFFFFFSKFFLYYFFKFILLGGIALLYVRLKTDLVPVEGLHPCSDMSYQNVVLKYK